MGPSLGKSSVEFSNLGPAEPKLLAYLMESDFQPRASEPKLAPPLV